VRPRLAGPAPPRYAAPGDRVLVLGDGDCSFSNAVLGQRARRGDAEAEGLICTCLDERDVVTAKYGPAARKAISALEASALSNICFGVDATALLDTLPRSVAAADSFNCVVFNFPHTGSQRVHENRAMLSSFFGNVGSVLVPGGRVDVAMNGGPPYNKWGLTELAEAHKFLLVDRNPFRFEDYPGYSHRTTLRGAAVPSPQLKRSEIFTFMAVG